METQLIPETSIPLPTPVLTDELRVYLVVNTDLNMSLGKTCVQTGHAVEYLLDKRDEIIGSCDGYFAALAPLAHKHLFDQAVAFNTWKNTSHCKIALAATTAEFNAVKAEYPETSVLVKDAGRTEIPPGSETVIGLFPMTKADRSKTLKTLKPL